MVSSEVCCVCGEASGAVYDGPVYGKQPDGPLCLFCIASGDASRELSHDDWVAEFTDAGVGAPPDVPRAVLEEVSHRTPGFRGWQDEHWLYHCRDAAAFLGRAGFDELQAFPDAVEMLQQEVSSYDWTTEESTRYLRSLHRDGDATAYLFRCLHCGRHLAYSDIS